MGRPKGSTSKESVEVDSTDTESSESPKSKKVETNGIAGQISGEGIHAGKKPKYDRK